MTTNDAISEFLASSRFAVVGASTDRSKYGNKCLRCYQQNGREVVPVNPREETVEGFPAARALSDVVPPPEAVSIITPPRVSVLVVEEAASLGIRHVWLQPGAEDEAVLRRARELGIEPIAGGPCLLVVLGFRDV